ncbi:MAG: D-isomer specific 2-hydroxyacid dehydrogenase family protein, partial [Pseudomonadales bacterium]
MQNEAVKKIAVEPANSRQKYLIQAVRDGGGEPVPASEATALIWGDEQLSGLTPMLHDDLEWVQLPWAGIEPFIDALDHKRQWTCGKGVYAQPVAEHVLALMLAGLHHLHAYAKETTWSAAAGQNLFGKRVLILGGGGITEELLPMLAAMNCDSVVLRRSNKPMDGARCVLPEALHKELMEADVVVLALALTDSTRGMIGEKELALMKNNAWLINVARGAHIVTDDLVSALQQGSIAGAALDVTDPEPLPDGHPLWSLDNCLITPHVGNTPEVGIRLLCEHVRENTRRYLAGETLLAPVDV